MTHTPSEATRAMVQTLSGFGIKYEDIALYLGITRPTLDKYYKNELRLGTIKANSTIAETLYKKARDGDTTACIFWLKTRAGWREVQKMELEGEVKEKLEMKTTLADLMVKNYTKKE